MRKLHIFTNDTDFVISESIVEAFRLLKQMTGMDNDEIGPLHIWDDDKDFTLRDEDDGSSQTYKAKEWCKIQGKGYFCSTEW